MNKRILIGMFAAASLLFATSCSNESLDTIQPGAETAVSFTLGVENLAQTRAISDGKSADKLIYAVFDENGQRITTMEQVIRDGVSFPTKETITLAKGQTYKIAFWAQDADCNAYTVDNNMNVAISYEGINNDERRDAFFSTVTISVDNNSTSTLEKGVTLKRPFAQLNVGVEKADWDAAVAAGVVIEKSDVTMSNVANSINLVDGSVSGSVEVSYTMNAIPTEYLMVDLDGDGKKEEYNYLSMNYLLVDDATGGANRALINEVEFNFYPVSGNPINFSTGLNNIPVQRNWRTNIVGKLLTSDVTYKIEIDPAYEDDINIDATIKADTPAQTIKDILENGGVVTVAETPEGGIDFSGLELKKDLYLLLNAPVSEIIVGGNNDGVTTKSVSSMPNITIEVAKDVEYPAFTFADYAENYIIKGHANSSKTMGTNFKMKSVKNIQIDGIAFSYTAASDNQYVIDACNPTDGLIVSNCVTTDLGTRFVNLQGGASLAVKNIQILNNTLGCKDGSKDAGLAREMDPIYAKAVENIRIEGNVITNSMDHHAIYTTGCKKLTITGNTVSNAHEDAIKVDIYDGTDATITNNTIVKATNNGVRVDNMNTEATVIITDNTISALCKGENTYGINLKNGSATAHILTIKNNVVGEDGIKKNCYFFINPAFTPSGDYEMPFSLINGVGLTVDGAIGISNAAGLKWVADVTNGVVTNNVADINSSGDQGAFQGQRIVLLSDLDLKGINWTPIGNSNSEINHRFAGAFDGGNHTISNLTISDSDLFCVGLFGYSVGSIKDLRLENVNITGNYCAGAIAGGNINNVIENCHVSGGTVTGRSTENVGGIVGLANESASNGVIRNCSVKNLTVTSGNNVGGLMGAGNAKLDGNTVANTSVLVDQRNTTVNSSFMIGEFVGWNLGANVLSNNTASDVTVLVLADGAVYDPATKTAEITAGGHGIQLAAALGATTLKLGEGTHIVYSAKGKTLTFIGTGDAAKTVIEVQVANGDANNDNALSGSKVTFENLTVETENNNFRGFGEMSGTYKNCIIKNQYTLYGESSFDGCTFDVTGDHYNVWTWGANASFKDCTFNCSGKAALVYGSGISTVTFDNCVFNDKGGQDGKAAIETGNDYDATYTINIKKCTVNGFDVNSVSGSNVWGNKNSMTADKLNVIIDGTEVY